MFKRGQLLAWVALILLATGPVTASTVPGDYGTIQEALNNALDGETVLVSDGTYYENIIFPGRDITLISVNGPQSTTIDGGWTGPVIAIETGMDQNSIIEGFTITRGISNQGGGIRFDRIDGEASSPRIKNCVITKNIATAGGGGVFIDSDDAPTLSGCIIIFNRAVGGGGIAVNNNTGGNTNFPIIEDCLIAGNETTGYGGGICSQSRTATIMRCTIADNVTDGNLGYGGGGLFCHDGSYAPTIENTIIWGNGPDGIDVHPDGPDPTIICSCIQGGWAGPGSDNIAADPTFCDPCEGDYFLAAGSPCLAAPICGLIGAFSQGCEFPAETTLCARINALPDQGTLPFTVGFRVSLQNRYSDLARRMAARINITLANGQEISTWRAGYTNIPAGEEYSVIWNQVLEYSGTLDGNNIFHLVAEDVTPPPVQSAPLSAVRRHLHSLRYRDWPCPVNEKARRPEMAIPACGLFVSTRLGI